eukprot:GHVN01069418.1.p1 GENE.GHVN01069418.1~~GHVN01069418.1.p1  ORF type:complete len:740 (+),score=70.03 GHVN01069418.1:303-2522(+)
MRLEQLEGLRNSLPSVLSEEATVVVRSLGAVETPKNYERGERLTPIRFFSPVSVSYYKRRSPKPRRAEPSLESQGGRHNNPNITFGHGLIKREDVRCDYPTHNGGANSETAPEFGRITSLPCLSFIKDRTMKFQQEGDCCDGTNFTSVDAYSFDDVSSPPQVNSIEFHWANWPHLFPLPEYSMIESPTSHQLPQSSVSPLYKCESSDELVGDGYARLPLQKKHFVISSADQQVAGVNFNGDDVVAPALPPPTGFKLVRGQSFSMEALCGTLDQPLFLSSLNQDLPHPSTDLDGTHQHNDRRGVALPVELESRPYFSSFEKPNSLLALAWQEGVRDDTQSLPPPMKEPVKEKHNGDRETQEDYIETIADMGCGGQLMSTCDADCQAIDNFSTEQELEMTDDSGMISTCSTMALMEAVGDSTTTEKDHQHDWFALDVPKARCVQNMLQYGVGSHNSLTAVTLICDDEDTSISFDQQTHSLPYQAEYFDNVNMIGDFSSDYADQNVMSTDLSWFQSRPVNPIHVAMPSGEHIQIPVAHNHGVILSESPQCILPLWTSVEDPVTTVTTTISTTHTASACPPQLVHSPSACTTHLIQSPMAVSHRNPVLITPPLSYHPQFGGPLSPLGMGLECHSSFATCVQGRPPTYEDTNDGTVVRHPLDAESEEGPVILKLTSNLAKPQLSNIKSPMASDAKRIARRRSIKLPDSNPVMEAAHRIQDPPSEEIDGVRLVCTTPKCVKYDGG